MGRQPKVGLDFWLRDVRLFRDPKLRKPRQEFGYLAPYIYECLLDILYSDKGYYIDFRGSARDDVIWELTQLTQGRYAVTAETMAHVIDSLVASGLFSGDLYRRGFITSKRAQCGYFSATLGRSSAQINFDIWLLSKEEMEEMNPSGKSPVLRSFISWQEKRISRQEKPVSCPESTQRRVEQSKEEQSKEENSIVDNSRAEQRVEQSRKHISDFCSELGLLIGAEIDKNFQSEIARMIESGMNEDTIWESARITRRKQPREPAPYLRAILKRSLQNEALKTPNRESGTAELAAWEKDWLDEMAARMQLDREKEEQDDPD